jgi:nickel-type superoxide dismutase maturation protease
MCRLLKVHGDSLIPDYQEGDFVLVSKIPFLFASPRPGQVVAFHMPPYGTLIKRVEQVLEGGHSFFVAGTHPLSVDSRQFGPVSRQALLGRVVWHIPKPG